MDYDGLGKVLALEAVPAAAAVFQKSVEWNNLTDVIQAGASDLFALGEFKDCKGKMQLFHFFHEGYSMPLLPLSGCEYRSRTAEGSCKSPSKANEFKLIHGG